MTASKAISDAAKTPAPTAGWTHNEAKSHSVSERLQERCRAYGGGKDCSERDVPLADWCERCLARILLLDEPRSATYRLPIGANDVWPASYSLRSLAMPTREDGSVMDRLTVVELEAVRTAHHGGPWSYGLKRRDCLECGQEWPCFSIRAAQEIALLEDQIDALGGEIGELQDPTGGA